MGVVPFTLKVYFYPAECGRLTIFLVIPVQFFFENTFYGKRKATNPLIFTV